MQQRAAEETTALGHAMLARLRELPWRRVDVCFRGTSMPYFAHNLIQARVLMWHYLALASHWYIS